MLNFFNTTFELAASKIDTAVLPLGGIEPKGPHLPVGLDLMLAERFARDYSAGKAVYLLPTLPYSTAMEARGFRGALAVTQETMWDALEDIARGLARHGFKRLVILNFSNCNWIVKHAAREINLDGGLIQTVWAHPKQFALESADRSLLPDYGGGAIETSLALALFPQYVKAIPPDFDAGVPREYIDYRGYKAVAPQGYWGRPSKASKQLGGDLYKVMLARTREAMDMCLGLFAGGKGAPVAAASVADDASGMEEIWWPDGEIPGVRPGGPGGPGAPGAMDWHNTAGELASAPDLAILPTGALEQHSSSQPLATDYVQALELGSRSAAALGAYLLPAMPIVTSWCHMDFRGTVTFRAMTVRKIVNDLADSLIAGGFKRLVILNVHGGNWVLKPTLIEINALKPGLQTIATGDLLAYRGHASVESMHSDENEASFIKAFYPKAFKAAGVVDFSPKCTAAALDTCGMAGVSPKGAWGYPSKATPEKGRANVEAQVAGIVAYVQKALAAIK